jgi:glycosyltransferase involved in cell wall biosynthesis
VAEPAPNGRPRILAFGKFGAGKRLELLTAAFRDLAADDPEVELVVAGQDHPRHPGYLQRMEQECRDLPQATFLGYVPEEQVPTVFRTSAVLAMPYTTTTGASGVLMQACMYGIPAVAADLPTLREMADQYGLALRFFPPGDQESLKCVLRELLAAPAQRMAMARHNLERVRADSLPAIADRYVALFRELIEEVRCGRKALPECRHGEGVPFGDDLGLIPAQEKPKRTL